MLEREWVSIRNPEDPYDLYVFDVSFLLSDYTCIYGRGCPGTGGTGTAETGCCSLGAHYIDEDDRAKVEAMVERLGPEHMQFHADATRRGVTATLPGGEQRTRVKLGACIFHNRADFHGGAGCALHQYAAARGEHHMTYKPDVCWIVPLRREVAQSTADDGAEQWTTTITSYDRGAWGPGGADFSWWCTDSAPAFVGEAPVYESMAAELREMVGAAVYAELAGYLDDRRRHARTPLPLHVQGVGAARLPDLVRRRSQTP